MMATHDDWNKIKKQLDVRQAEIYFKEREIWWCSIGKNIGREQNGKNASFERPVLILKKLAKDVFIGLPQTTKKPQYFSQFFEYKYKNEPRFLLLNQIRTLSSKRLLRKVDILSKKEFTKVSQLVKEIF